MGQVLPWDEVVQRIVELQRTSRLCIIKDQLTAHDIANRILRKDNFMVAMVNRGLLPLQVGLLGRMLVAMVGCPAHPIVRSGAPPMHAVLSPQSPSLLPFNLLTKALEWNLYVCVFNAMFDKRFRIRQTFTQDVRALQRRFVFCGVLNLLLAPFVAAFMLIFFFLKHAEEWYRRPAASALSRDYSRHARWMMMEFNELPHVFEARMHASVADANAYIKQFPAPLVTLLARFVTFIVSSLAAVLLVLSLLNENILIYYRFPHEQLLGEAAAQRLGSNLLWWLAMFSTVLAISRSFSVEGAYPVVHIQPNALLEVTLLVHPTAHTMYYTPHSLTPRCPPRGDDLAGAVPPLMPFVSLCAQSFSRHTHYMPEHWRGKAHTRHVYLEFRQLYQSRVVLLMHEILGCITAPFLLCFAFPSRSEQILEFIRNFTAYSEGVGHVCSFALFDFERHGDMRYGAPSAGLAEQRSCDGKMEKAYVNFRVHHPSWQDERGEALLDNVRRSQWSAAIRRG